MSGKRGIALTQAGECVNPACRAPLYVELMAASDAEACFECDPEQFREGWHPMFAELFAEPMELNERHGGRVPPISNANPLCSGPCCGGAG